MLAADRNRRREIIGQAESLGRLEVDPEQKRRRLLDWNVGLLRSPKDAVHEDRRSLEEAGETVSVGDQTSSACPTRYSAAAEPSAAIGSCPTAGKCSPPRP